jgi:hypothetical protein
MPTPLARDATGGSGPSRPRRAGAPAQRRDGCPEQQPAERALERRRRPGAAVALAQHALDRRDDGRRLPGQWIPLPYVDEGAAEKLFRRKMLALLRRRGLLTEERIELLNSWRRSGFSVHNQVYVHHRDGREFEALVSYMIAPP